MDPQTLEDEGILGADRATVDYNFTEAVMGFYQQEEYVPGMFDSSDDESDFKLDEEPDFCEDKFAEKEKEQK